MTDDNPMIIHTRLLGGPAHGHHLRISTYFRTVFYPMPDGTKVEYVQRRFSVRNTVDQVIFCWSGLTEREIEAQAAEVVCG